MPPLNHHHKVFFELSTYYMYVLALVFGLCCLADCSSPAFGLLKVMKLPR